jgi:1,4-alpha-glucan branching enzyme
MLLDYEMHRKVQNYVRALNHVYAKEPAFWELDHAFEGFEWIDSNNHNQSIIAFMRKGKKPKDTVIIICNFTPVSYEDFRIGVPYRCSYSELFNSDWYEFGGSGQRNTGILSARKQKWQDREYSINVKVPPLGAVFLKPAGIMEEEAEQAEEVQQELALKED